MRKRINVREIIIILVGGACIGVLFNLVSKNKIPFVAPTKAEIYAQKNIPTVSMEEAKARFDRGGFLFLDARDAEDYERNHVKGALNLPVRHFDLYYPKMKELLPKDRHIVVYCASPECNASLYLAEELVRRKYEHVEVMLGGWLEWDNAGYPDEGSGPAGG